MPQTQSRIDDKFLQPGGTKIGRDNNIPGNNALIIGNSNNAFSEENLIIGDFNVAAGKALIIGDENITSDSQVPIFVIGNNNTTPPNSNGIIAGKYMTFSQIFDNGYVFGADGLYQTYSINDFMIIGDNYPATQSFTHSGRVYINWDVEFSPDINVIGLTGSLIGSQGPQGNTGVQGAFGGPQGETGPTGAQGFQGPIGNTGVQGEIGPTGVQGAFGGPQGNTGPTGNQGLIGNTGPQGFQGNTGSQGLVGPTGVGGALGHYGSFYSLLKQSFTQSENIIYDNTRYSNGITTDGVDKIFLSEGGVYSINIILNFKVYNALTDINNDVTYYISKNGSEILYTGAYYNNPNSREGIKGVNFLLESNSGDYFQIGVYGYTYSALSSVYAPSIEGATQSYNGTPIDIPSTILNVHQVMYTQIGPSGSQGISGPTGSNGVQGNTGPQGLIGNTGSTGSNGIDGNTGFQGPIGNTGSNGTIGVDGNTGPQGFQGNIGPSGSNGSQGFQGPQGLTGPQGALSSDKGSIGVIFDGFGGVPIVGKTDWIVVPYNGTITGWQIFSGTTGSCVIDVRKDTYGNFPPTAADSIAGTEKPTLISQIKNEDLSLSSWTASVTSGDIVQFYLESASLLTKINCVIFIDKN